MIADGNEARNITQGSGPLTLNLLENASPPNGTTASITSFTLPGSSVVYPAGPTPVTVTDPVSNTTTGTIVVLANGTTTFTPAPRFSGTVPLVSYTVASSDGQTDPSVLSITVTPGENIRTIPFTATLLLHKDSGKMQEARAAGIRIMLVD